MRKAPLGDFLDRKRVLMFLSEADTCQHGLGVKSGATEAPWFTAREEYCGPNRCCEAGGVYSLGTANLFFCYLSQHESNYRGEHSKPLHRSIFQRSSVTERVSLIQPANPQFFLLDSPRTGNINLPPKPGSPTTSLLPWLSFTAHLEAG